MIDGVHVMVGQSAVSVQGRMRYSLWRTVLGLLWVPLMSSLMTILTILYTDDLILSLTTLPLACRRLCWWSQV